VKKLKLFLVILLVSGLAPTTFAYNIFDGTVSSGAFTDFKNYCKNCPTSSLLSENFEDTSLVSGLAINSGFSLTTYGTSFHVADGTLEDIINNGLNYNTSFSYNAMYGFGGFFNLNGPGGPGTGIAVYADGVFVDQISNIIADQFWGFYSPTPFSTVVFKEGTLSGSQETYYSVDLAMCVTQPVPIPAAAWLLGSGLIGLVGIRRRFKK
jgi:hypothetical protein